MTERLTNIPTASQRARQAALEKIGKDMAWYDAQVIASLNDAGEPTCAACGLPERKKLPGGQIKPLRVDTKNVRLICDSCGNKLDKQRYQETVAKRHDRESTATVEEFHVRHRNTLTEKQKVEHEDRDDYIIGTNMEMRDFLRVFWDDAMGYVKRGVDLTTIADQPFRSFIREVCDDVVEHGTLEVFDNDFFRPEQKDYYDQTQARADQNGKNLALYQKFGYQSALNCSLLHRFLGLVEAYLGLPVSACEDKPVRIDRIVKATDGIIWKQPDQVVICCERPCMEITRIPAGQIPPTQWRCPKHEKAGQELAQAAAKKIREQRLEEHAVFGDRAEYR
jgi:hypothetical protein